MAFSATTTIEAPRSAGQRKIYDKQILVTGGAGFIGSNFVRYIMNRYPNYRILILDALTYAGSVENLPKIDHFDEEAQLVFWYGNVCNAGLVEQLVSECDYVVHFAAETHVERSIYDNLPFFQTDVLGTQAIANSVVKLAGRVSRLVHVSTSEVYGTALAERIDEDHALNPRSPYASAKCGADRLVYSYWATYGVPATIVRPFNNFGPYQHLEKLISRFITSIILGEPLRVHGAGQAARDFVFVTDTCRAIDAVLHAPGEAVEGQTFNIASGRHRTIIEIAEEILERMGGRGSRIEFVKDRPGQVERHTGDWSKINQVVGWSPEVSWEEGLDRTIRWFESNRAWWEPQIWLRTVPARALSGAVERH
jgi:dTDP-glucose 4,6-dehydratase